MIHFFFVFNNITNFFRKRLIKLIHVIYFFFSANENFFAIFVLPHITVDSLFFGKSLRAHFQLLFHNYKQKIKRNEKIFTFYFSGVIGISMHEPES